MDAIRKYLENPKIVGLVAFILGLIIGLVVLGWGPLKVQYYDAAPEHMQKDYRFDYLRMAVEAYSYEVRIDPVEAQKFAQERWRGLGPYAAETLAQLKAKPGKLDPAYINAFSEAITAPAAEATPGAEQKASGGISLLLVVGIMCAITLLLGGAVVAYLLLSGKRGGEITPAQQAQEAARHAQMTDYAAMGEELPIAQFMASYKLGDDLFDDSFSIDSQSGEFLGECGVGISETIGVGDPKKVAAFEVWLFDKNDIQTVTKVIMSAHTFVDDAVKQRLAAKGEPVLAEVGKQVVLETASLQLVARVVEMTYGEGALPPESFFDQFILELAIWQKNQ
jgi:hypothetical protein